MTSTHRSSRSHRFKHPLPRSLTARLTVSSARRSLKSVDCQNRYAGVCCEKLAVSTRTPAPIVEETLTFFR